MLALRIPIEAPAWAQDRAALLNAAEARETRSNSVTASEWELALPSEISDAARIEIIRAFAQRLVERYGVAADVAIHAPAPRGRSDPDDHPRSVSRGLTAKEYDGFTTIPRTMPLIMNIIDDLTKAKPASSNYFAL